jgi:hypothetical protein
MFAWATLIVSLRCRATAATQDLGGAGRKVICDLGVVVGQDALNELVGLQPLVLGVAGGDLVEQRHVFLAAGKRVCPPQGIARTPAVAGIPQGAD